jgi:hypothetical protein
MGLVVLALLLALVAPALAQEQTGAAVGQSGAVERSGQLFELVVGGDVRITRSSRCRSGVEPR